MTTATNNNKSAAATTNDAEPVHRTAPAPRVRAQRLIEDLFIETDSLKLVGARRGLSLDLLLKTLSTPEALDAMRNLRRLADERTALLLARARADAARRLIELACDDEPAARETARRA
ncbi:MAG: hypothetical protein VYC34_02060, partial [Planctomycetota bacterium]|nr:hypothetical protein [Planctomycetota bacterium]